MTDAGRPDLELVGFVNGCLDSVQERTRKLLADVRQVMLFLKEPRNLGKFAPGWYLWADVERVCVERLADVDFKREIIRLHESPGGGCPKCWDSPCQTVVLLAQPYAGLAGWREQWQLRIGGDDRG